MASADFPGEFVGPYRILGPLGDGGMGEVFLGEDARLRRKVAIKFLSRELALDEEARQRLLKEAQILASLDHPNICPIYEVENDGALTYIVMQHVEGDTLAARIRAGTMTVREALEVSVQVLDALAEAHAHHIVHRDVKPLNIMVSPRRRVKVLDFGIAKAVGQTATTRTASGIGRVAGGVHTESGAIIGSIHYMSPEQAAGAMVDQRSDIFSFGAVLYECLTGRYAFQGADNWDVLGKIKNADPPLPSEIDPQLPAELDEIVMKALQKSPDARYQSARDMADDLRSALSMLEKSGLSGMSHSGRHPRPPTSTSTSLRALLRPAYLFAAAAIAAAISAWALYPWTAAGGTRVAAAQEWYQKGIDALRTGAAYQASRLFERSIKADSAFAMAHARLAETYVELDNRLGAQEELLQVHNLVPNRRALARRDRLYVEAISASVSGDTDTAVARYEELARLDPKRPEPFVDLGYALEKSNKVDAAVDDYTHAIELDPDYAPAHLRLGILYGRQQQQELADHSFAAADKAFQDIGSVEGRAEVHYRRGFVLRNRDDLEPARAELQQAYELAKAAGNEPTQILTTLQLSSIAFAEGNAAEAERLAREGVDLAQQRNLPNVGVRALIDLGNSLLVQNQNAKAEDYFRAALANAQTYKNPSGEARAQFSLGNLRIMRGQIADGLPLVDQALGFFHRGNYVRETMQAQMVKARAQRDMGDLSGATATFNELLTNARRTNNESQVATTIDDLARAFYLQEKYADAYDALKENCGVYEKRQARFDAGYCYANLGTVQWHLGGYAEAMTSFERARSIAEGPSGFPGLLGTVYGDVAEMELSRRNIPQSLKALEAAAASGDNDDLETVINLTVVRGLSAVYSGHPVEGVRLCRQAVETATAKGASPWLIGPAQVALAEALLAAGDYDAAADTAIRTQDTFAQTGQLVSSFRAWTIATLAFRALHDGPKSASSEKSMREAAAKLENALRPDAYLRFRARPDIVALTGRIDASH